MKYAPLLALLLFFFACQHELDPNLLPKSDTSKFTLTASAGACSHIEVAGAFKTARPVTASNYIKADVIATKAGTWSGYTDTIGGVWFEGSGEFTTTGQQQITLYAHGTPTQTGPNSFVIHAGKTTCSFVLTVYDGSVNIPPTANAGKDTTLYLPATSLPLNGTGTDPDGAVVSYQWTVLSGSATITPSNAASTQVSNLTTGTYQFVLTVTDDGGVTGKDTVNVMVKEVIIPGALHTEQLMVTANAGSNNLVYDMAGHITGTSSTTYADRKIYYNANNTISKIEVYYSNGTDNYLGYSYEFAYDGAGNVTSIYSKTSTGEKSVLAEYTYNSDNTLKTKKTLVGAPHLNGYLYTNGNVTAILDYNISGAADTTFITYDTRVNNFKSISPQFYFLSIQTTIDESNRSEPFFFSKNYPVSYDGDPVTVTTVSSTNLKPTAIAFNGTTWFRYTYNP